MTNDLVRLFVSTDNQLTALKRAANMNPADKAKLRVLSKVFQAQALKLIAEIEKA